MSDLIKDPLDFGTHIAEVEREDNVRAIQRRAAPKQVKNADGTWPEMECVMCGNEIGLKRIEATGANTCIPCQELIERKGKQYAN